MSRQKVKFIFDLKRQKVRSRFHDIRKPDTTRTPTVDLCTLDDYQFKFIGKKRIKRSEEEKEKYLNKLFKLKYKELKKAPIKYDNSKNELLKKHKKLIQVLESEREKNIKILHKMELLKKSSNTSESDNSAVYFVKGIHTETFKIGVSANYLNRFKELRTSCSEPLVMYGIISCFHISHAKAIENAIHSKYQDRVSGGGSEWFYVSDKEATESIQKYNGYVLYAE